MGRNRPKPPHYQLNISQRFWAFPCLVVMPVVSPSWLKYAYILLKHAGPPLADVLLGCTAGTHSKLGRVHHHHGVWFGCRVPW
jgi:hypothetical protein